MDTAGFCRNCLSKLYRGAAEERGIEVCDADARTAIFGVPYEAWKGRHQGPFNA